MELPRHSIGLDIETTALEPAAGDIIEVAAIRYDLATGKEIERIDRLAKPTQPISQEISSLTGITQEMVADAEPFKKHIADLKKFIGEDIIFAHNAPFDLGFLAYHGLKLSNNVWDTFPLSSIAWPEAESYNLGTLADLQGIAVAGEHRAAADITLTWELLQKIRQQLTISPAAYDRIKTVLAAASQEHYLPLFTPSAKERDKQPQAASESTTKAANTKQPKNIGEALGEGGALAKVLTEFSPRPGQLAMAEHVQAAMENRETALFEAGTGTGKTYAYLVPALLNEASGPVVISTYTKNLQDQLMRDDLPKLQAALNTAKKAALLKGRRNYLCNRRFGQFLTRSKLSPDAAMVALKIIIWLEQGSTGDLEQLNMSHQGEHFLRAISADSPACRLECTAATGCPYQRARQRASQADILVVNHALLVRISLGEEAAINPRTIIIDEAHHLEEAARAATALDLTLERVRDITDPIMQRAQKRDDAANQHLVTECQNLISEYRKLVQRIGAYVAKYSRYSELRLSSGVRRSNEWRQVVLAATKWRGRLKFTLGLIRSAAGEGSGKDKKVAEESVKQAEQLNIELDQFMTGNPERIQWIESWLPPGPAAERQTRLVDVALSLEAILEPLLNDERGTILTSATLTTGGDFSYIKRRLGIDKAREESIPTVIPFKENMFIYLVDDSPHPSATGYDSYIAKHLTALSTALSGRILALFTSQRAVAETYREINRSLNKAKIKVYAQKLTGGKTNITKRFKETATSVLLGTDSFWEGIDIPGDTLSLVAITKLPFPLPNDPITEAIAEAEDLNAFRDIALPQMILKLRQGIGRLLRHHTDQGAVVIFDPRFHQQAYGSDVIKSLPPGQVHIGGSRDLLPKITEWFGAEQLQNWQTQAEADHKK